MKLYWSPGFRSIRAEGIEEAAKVFASRAARRSYGRSGYYRTFLVGSRSQDCSMIECSAFIGYTTGPNETTGHSIKFNVSTLDGGAK